MPEDTPLTPLEQSRADHGRRCYAIKAGFYMGLYTSLNAKKNRPTGVGTKAVTFQEIPLPDDVPDSTDGRKLLSYRTANMTDEEFDEVFNPHIPNIKEVTWDEWQALFTTDD